MGTGSWVAEKGLYKTKPSLFVPLDLVKTLKVNSSVCFSVLAHIFLLWGMVYFVDAGDFESMDTETNIGMAIVDQDQVALHILPLLLLEGILIAPSSFVSCLVSAVSFWTSGWRPVKSKSPGICLG